jgi:hypothetical protein
MKRLLLFLALAIPALAQMTPAQREFDFRVLAANLNRYYAPSEWKRQLFGFDMFDLRPWLEKIRNAKDDLDYYDICSAYISSLGDSHANYTLPSNFIASTGVHVDIYDGKLVIDNVVRSVLPANRFPFGPGDELLAVDGKPALELLESFKQYTYSATADAAARSAAARLLSRPQILIPRAHEIGDTVSIRVRRANGAEEDYTLPWIKSGQPLLNAGPVPSPNKTARAAARSVEEESAPAYMAPLLQLQNTRVEFPDPDAVLNIGSSFPVWAFPASAAYTPRPFSFFRNGVFQAEGFRVGFLRIPSFSPTSNAAALAELDSHIQFLQENTDGLIVDVMRNPGGNACLVEEIQRRLIPYTFRAVGFELLANRLFLNSFSAAYENARASNADAWVVQSYAKIVEEMQGAIRENRPRTGSLPLCSPSLERVPAAVTYTKPLMVMTDLYSASGADMFPAAIQDANRGIVFGTRTNGAGGNVFPFQTGVYSEAVSSATGSLMTRRNPMVIHGYPTSSYIENVGVHPDVYADVMTLDNLRTGGRPFVEAFSRAIAEHIRNSR